VKYPLFLSSLNETSFLDRFSKHVQISNFMKLCPIGVELFHADGWTDLKLIVSFRSFATASNIPFISVLLICQFLDSETHSVLHFDISESLVLVAFDAVWESMSNSCVVCCQEKETVRNTGHGTGNTKQAQGRVLKYLCVF
jgi:hypothetical protein